MLVSDEQFSEYCWANPDLRIERTATGKLVILPPVGGETGIRSGNLSGQLWLWNESAQSGVVFDASTGFKLSNSAIRSPDAAWLSQARWDRLTSQQRQGFAPLCPDFVVELCSLPHELIEVRAKMVEYLNNGARLGWLLDLERRTAEIYQPEQDVKFLRDPATISGEPVLSGFVLDARQVFF